MKLTVKDLIAKIIDNCFFVNPAENEIIVQMYERDNDGNVIDIHEYPITAVKGADGYNRICIEMNYKR